MEKELENNEKNETEVKNLSPLFDARRHSNFRELLNYAAFQYMTDDAFIVKEGKDENGDPIYRHITYRDFKNDVNWFGTGMMDMGMTGKRIAIIGKNSYEWYMTYYSVLCGLGIVVPLDKGLPYEEIVTSLIKSRSDVLIFDKDHLDLAKKVKESGETSVSTFISMEEEEGFPVVQDIIKKGCAVMTNGNEKFTELPINPDAMSVILFTSGTTSKAKAVMLSQMNILTNVFMLDLVEDVHHGDTNIAFLPYHHTFGSSGQTMMISLGVTTVFCDGLKYIQKNLQEYHVTVFVCVPLLIEAMYWRIQQTIDKQGKRKKFQMGLTISRFLKKIGIDVRRKIFKEILDQLGGKLRYLVSGASALDPVVVRGYEDLGISVVQGYGMTEASPVITGENSENKNPGSIGFALPGIECKVIDQNEEGIGELVARGPNVMLGYYEDHEATSEILKDNWLHTGDLVSVDKDGFVFIRGRKKNVIVLKNGKNVYPEEIESVINDLPYVKESLVSGEKRKKDGDSKDLALSARIVYDREVLEREYGLKPESGEDVIKSIVKRDLDKINSTMPTYKNILRFEITDEPMEKTTTGKIKRYAGK